ncbi:uncharacterized protein [Dermacentor andersoni]|uniref:uncharacterized protein n=1 Tax=Dermacentor andersoni TaxID=34620 RepID=UPI002417BEC2|nr:uncharacterized protein LOC126544273 [Dermacentor andersoni]
MRAKALFGEAMRMCKKELVAYARTIPSEKIRKVLAAACSAYNNCKTLADEHNLEPAYNCLASQALNATSPYAMWLNMSDEYRHAAQGVLLCLWKGVLSRGVDGPAIDDAVAFTRRAVLTFGWT